MLVVGSKNMRGDEGTQHREIRLEFHMIKYAMATAKRSVAVGGSFEQFEVDKKNLAKGNIQCLRVNY